MSPIEVFAAQPPFLKAWLLWLFAINVASVVFLRRVEARWVLLAMILNVAGMAALPRFYGGGPHMSLPHVVLWTPLLVYLARRRHLVGNLPRPYAAWAALLFCSNAVSLVLDYANIAKWVLK